jgi:hypothetical protein
MGPLFAFLGPLLSKALDLIPNPADRLQQFQLIMTALQQWDAEQNEVNKVEAANPSVFVSGWRPAIGWTCAFALFYQYIVVPFATWGFALHHIEVPPLPKLDENLWQLTTGMLGLGGLRTLEKLKGVTK